MTIAALARLVGAVAVLIPLGATILLSFLFGRDTFGDGNVVYGVLWASFSVCSAAAVFGLSDALRLGQRDRALSAGLLIAVCMTCAVAGSWMSLGSRQDELSRREAARQATAADLAAARAALSALPVHRDQAAIDATIKLRERTYGNERAAHRASRAKGEWHPSPQDVAADLSLINETATIRTAESLAARIRTLEAASTADGPRATAVVAWVSQRLGWSTDGTGQALMLAFVATSELVAALGLFVVLGAPDPRRRSEEPAPISLPEPQVDLSDAPAQTDVVAAVTVAPAARAEIVDPIAAFLGEMAVPGDSVTAYADIQESWNGWCVENGITGTTVNLGLALRRSGYAKTVMPGTRRAGYAGLRLAVRKAA